jgi:chromosome segregation protein
VEALEKAGIRLGVIANHNKFDLDEFKALRKTAQKKGIALLPGVELSVERRSQWHPHARPVLRRMDR